MSQPFKMYLVGGAVRNHLLGLPVKDYDFAVRADSYEEMKVILEDNYELISYKEDPSYVTIRGLVRLPSGSFGGIIPSPKDLAFTKVAADFTLCRAETMYADRRHPSTVTPTDLLTDLSRRDFTMNAIAVTSDGVEIDPYNGELDLLNGVLRCVGDPAARMEEDPLRLLRAIRFMVTLGLRRDYKLSAVMDDSFTHDHIRHLPLERIREELDRAAKHDSWALIDALRGTGMWRTLKRYFPDLWFKPTQEAR